MESGNWVVLNMFILSTMILLPKYHNSQDMIPLRVFLLRSKNHGKYWIFIMSKLNTKRLTSFLKIVLVLSFPINLPQFCIVIIINNLYLIDIFSFRSVDAWGLGCLLWEIFNTPLENSSSMKKVSNVRIIWYLYIQYKSSLSDR